MVAARATSLQRGVGVLIKQLVDRHQLVNWLGKAKLDNGIGLVVGRKGIFSVTQKICGFIQVQLQGKRQGDNSFLAGMIILFAQLGKQLAINICPFVHINILQASLVDEVEELGLKGVTVRLRNKFRPGVF